MRVYPLGHSHPSVMIYLYIEPYWNAPFKILNYDLMDLLKEFVTERSIFERGGARRQMRKLAGSHPAHNEKYETQTDMEDA